MNKSELSTKETENPYLNLANAIIIQAVQDYETILRNGEGNNLTAHWGTRFDMPGSRQMLESFFKSDYFVLLTRGCVSGYTVMDHVKAKITNKTI